MNRRKAFFGMFLLSGASYLGYKFLSKDPFSDPNEYLMANMPVIDEITDLIIPETDTPGSKGADVANTLVKLIIDCTDRKSQQNFYQGLEELKHYCLKKFDREFIACSLKEKILTLQNFEESGLHNNGIIGKVQRRYFGKNFISLIKEYTVRAYFTSLQGATQELSYVAAPGKRLSCIDMEENQKSWATQ